MAFQKLLLDMADCEARAHGIRKELVGNAKLGLDFVGIDYMDTLNVKNQLHMGKTALRGLKDLSKALRSLLNHVDYSVYKIQDAMFPLVLHDGLNVVPDDILAMIFEKAFESAPESTRHLASVNRRFRNAALSLPRLWSILPEDSGKEAFDLYLARSRDVGLIVDVQDVSSWYGKEMLQLAHRWESVNVQINQDDTHGVNLQSLSCPRVQAIFVDVIYASESSGRPKDFKIEWNLPALRRITFKNAMPALPPCVLKNLTSLEFKLENDGSYCHFPIAAFLRQLSHMENLQVLSLSLCYRFEEESPTLLCNLSSLTDFNVELSGVIMMEHIETFLDNINMKNVRRFSAKLAEDALQGEFYFPDSIISSIFYTSDLRLRFPSMEAATLKSGPKLDVARSRNLAIIHALDQPALKSLCISSVDALFLDPRLFTNNTWKFRNVSIIDCISGVQMFLDLLFTHVNPDGTRPSDSIETLRVLGCPEVTMNYLLDFLPEEKIDWSPVADTSSSQ